MSLLVGMVHVHKQVYVTLICYDMFISRFMSLLVGMVHVHKQVYVTLSRNGTCQVSTSITLMSPLLLSALLHPHSPSLSLSLSFSLSLSLHVFLLFLSLSLCVFLSVSAP